MSDPFPAHHVRIIEPPILPPPLIDENESATGVKIESTWDTLARTMLGTIGWSLHGSDRKRVTWVRRCLFIWCCGRPMRLAVMDHQPRHVSFGWERSGWKKAACNQCGRIKDLW
jgi:hypothetical protein